MAQMKRRRVRPPRMPRMKRIWSRMGTTPVVSGAMPRSSMG
jgi:hypothetical protein